MRFLIHLVAESEVGQRVQEIACLDRNEPRLENIGLSLWEASTNGGVAPDFIWDTEHMKPPH